jgi:hypothetical protein
MSTQISKKRLSWNEKLDNSKGLPKVGPIGPTMSKRWGEGTMVVPAPREVEAVMKSVPAGKLITIQEIRAMLARKHGTTIACPLTTGIFAWISAHAAEEEARSRGGAVATTPYWRTLKAGGFLNEKYPGGALAQKAKLEGEGHRVGLRGKRYAVVDFERSLAVPRARER